MRIDWLTRGILPRMADATPELGLKDDGVDGSKPEKDRWDLLPLGPVREVVRVLTFGARKYKAWNWIHVDDAVERYYSALLRHLYAWRSGEKYDLESGIHHLAHVLCDGMFMLWFELRPVQPSKPSQPPHRVSAGFGPDPGR